MRTRLVAVGALVLLVAACAQGPVPDAAVQETRTVVRYLSFGSVGGLEYELDTLLTAFEAENPDIDVDARLLPYEDFRVALQAAIADGSAPDVFELNHADLATFARDGSLAPLTDVETARYIPSLLSAFAVDGTQYGLPQTFSTTLLFYNRTLFERAGVPVPTDSWTWADEQAAAVRLTDPAAGVWGDHQSVSYLEFAKVLAQAGGSFLSADGRRAAFNTPQGLAAATWLVGKSGTTMPSGVGAFDADTELFESGRLAMWHTGDWMIERMQSAPFEWDVIVEPGATRRASAVFVNPLVVSSTAREPGAAQRLIAFLTASETAIRIRLETAAQLPAVVDRAALAPYLRQPVPANREAVLDAVDDAVMPPAAERRYEIEEIVTRVLTEAAAGRRSVPQALADAEQAVNALLGG